MLNIYFNICVTHLCVVKFILISTEVRVARISRKIHMQQSVLIASIILVYFDPNNKIYSTYCAVK